MLIFVSSDATQKCTTASKNYVHLKETVSLSGEDFLRINFYTASDEEIFPIDQEIIIWVKA